MIYRNKRTGRVIDILSEAGGDWEPVTAEAPDKAPDPEPKTPPKKPAPRKKPTKKE